MQTQHRDGDDREDGLELSRKLKGFCWNFLREGEGGLLEFPYPFFCTALFRFENGQNGEKKR